MRKLFLLIILAAVPTVFADTKIIYDKAGMPRCLSNTTGRELIFVWDERDHYQREVFALDTATYKPLREKKFSCAKLPALVSDTDVPQLYLVKKEDKTIAGFDLTDSRLQKAFDQIRIGGNHFREENDAKEFVSKRPNLEFTRELNRKLTPMYGVGFVSEIYGAALDARPENKKFIGLVDDIIKKKKLKIPAKRTVIYVKGLFQELKSSQKYDALIDHLKGLGIEVVVVQTLSSNGTRANVFAILEVLERQLAKGKNVVMISLSKGGLESLAALSALNERIEGPKAFKGYGKVEAFLSLSGMYSGSFVVDDSLNHPSHPRMQEYMLKLYNSENLPPTSLVGLMDLYSPRVEKTFETIVKNGLPQKTVYVSVVATTGGNGLAGPGFIRQLQDTWIRPYLEELGANDGYVEYPGTQIPRKFVKNAYEINVTGTHILVDGEYHGAKMLDGKPSAVHAILGAVFQLIEGNPI